MLKANIIHSKHLHSIQASLLKNRSVLDETMVNELYDTAKKVFLDSVKGQVDPKFMVSRFIVQPTLVGATATDVQTGLFIQFSGDPKLGMDGALMVFGQKYCQEIMDSMRQNISTRMWSK